MELKKIYAKYPDSNSVSIGTPSLSGDTLSNYLKNSTVIKGQKPVENITSNGLFDGPAKQENSNCVAHASINAIRVSKSGQTMLQDYYHYNDSTGVSSSYLKEADAMGLGLNNNVGVYTYTSSQVKDIEQTISVGDSDYTAYINAMGQYDNSFNNSFCSV